MEPPHSHYMIHSEVRLEKGLFQVLTLKDVSICADCAAGCPGRGASCEYTGLTMNNSVGETTTLHAVSVIDETSVLS